jgi:Ser/Thr protein kinase RdoA (MazF antagonist)
MSATGIAHGLDGKMVEPDWPSLTLPEVRALLSRYSGFSEPVEILSVSPRPFSAASVVRTPGGRVFIKRHHHAVRDSEGLVEEHRFMAHLLARGAAVPRVHAAATGETAIEAGEWTYEVHEAPDGLDLYGDALSWTPFRTIAHARSAGQALARLHLASKGFSAAQRKARPLVASFTIFAGENPVAEMDNYLAARPELRGSSLVRNCCNEALDLLDPYYAELRPLLPALKPLWTHNDLHASNLLWSDGLGDARATAIIDFGLADRTNAVHDIAHAIERNIVEWLALEQASGIRDKGSGNSMSSLHGVPVHLDHLIAMLDGYETVRPLSAEEAAAVAPMTALCHAEFALSETDYFLNVLHSQEKAAMACDGWLVGHARWFSSSAGICLLDAIRRWAQTRNGRFEGVARL